MQLLQKTRDRLAGTTLLVRVIALVSLGLGIVFVGFAMLSAQSIRDSTARTLQERQVIAEVTARNLDDRLHQMASLASVEASRMSIGGGNGGTGGIATDWEALRLRLGPPVQLLAAIDARGRIQRISPHDEVLVGLDISEVPSFQVAVNGETVIDSSESLAMPSALLGTTGATSVSILSPISLPQGGLVLIVVDLSQPGIADLLGHTVLGQTGYCEVVRADGRVLTSTRRDRIGVMSDHGGQLNALISEGKAIVGTCHDCHGESAIAAITEDTLAFAPLPRSPLGVAVRQASREAFAFGDALFQRALMFGAVSFVAALVVSWIIVIRLVQPVKVLTSACLRIAEGDLSQPIPPMGGGEMSILANSFETMRSHLVASHARLKASQEEIRRWGRELEHKVLERTAELQEARDNLERSRDYLITLFDSIDDQLAVIDRDYRVVEVNRAVQRRCGEEKVLAGEPCYLALRGAEEPCELQRGGCPAKAVWRTGQPSRVTQVHLDGSGRATYLDIVVSPITDGHGNVVNVLELARDVTESKRLEDQVIRTSEELSTLVSLSSAIACSMDLRAMLGLALDHVLALMDAAAGGILVEPVEGEAEPTVVARGLDAGEARMLVTEGHRPKDRMEVRKAQFNGSDLLCVPIATSETVLGEMFISCPSEHCFGGTGLQLLVSVGSQLAVAIENARLYEAVRRKEEDISAFLRKYIAAQEDERKRIARELHDETAQSLTALAIAIETALQKPTNSPAEVKRLLVPARSLTERVSRELDRIIRDLRPSLLDDLGLMEALGWYADNRLKPLGIQVTFETVGTERRLPTALETALFRVTQEGISNIARHSKAENVSLTVEFGDNYVAIDLEDDGCGFDVDSTLAKGKDGSDDSPFGLLGMRERTELMGGSLAVESRPGQGTSIRVRVPLDAERVYA